MTSKIIIAGLVAIAFVAGSIMTDSTVFAEKEDKNSGIITALTAIADAITGIDPDVTIDPTPVTVNVDPTPITINAPQGEKGETGADGEKGDTGADGEKGETGDPGADGTIQTVQRVEEFVSIPSESTGTAQSVCPVGTVVVGGGYDILHNPFELTITENYPIMNDNLWSTSVYNGDTTSNTIVNYALCLSQ